MLKYRQNRERYRGIDDDKSHQIEIVISLLLRTSDRASRAPYIIRSTEIEFLPYEIKIEKEDIYGPIPLFNYFVGCVAAFFVHVLCTDA